jgi:hypothetical protein
LDKDLEQLFNAAADIFHNQLSTIFKKREQGPSGGKALQVQVTIHGSYARALTMESDESYELYISQSDDGKVMYTDTMLLIPLSVGMLHSILFFFLSLCYE